jgi:hypothetical protein
MLFLIPSWRQFIGHAPLGKYLNKSVLGIHSDPVVFFASLECTIISSNRKLHFLFGQGYYYVKFEITKGTYTVDKRRLTGLILSDFAYNYMQRSPDIALEKDLDVVIKDYIFKIPLDLSNKTDQQIGFIQGSISRNVFVPRKEIILEVLQALQDEKIFLVEKSGHQLLSTYRLHYNHILVSDQMQSASFISFMDSIPGLDAISLGADQLLRSYFMPDDLQTIKKSISNLEQVFATLEYDPMSLSSTLEKVGDKLSSTLDESKYYVDQKIRNGENDFLLHSANYPIDTIIEWPIEFERTLRDVSPSTLSSSQQMNTESDDYDLGNYRQGPVELTEKFELKILKQEPVVYKPLPPLPKGDMEVVLTYVKEVVEDKFTSYQVGDACEQAWNAIRNMVLHSDLNWELSTLANYYHKQKGTNLGLSERDKNDILGKLNSWIAELKKEKALEQEFLDQEHREKERELKKAEPAPFEPEKVKIKLEKHPTPAKPESEPKLKSAEPPTEQQTFTITKKERQLVKEKARLQELGPEIDELKQKLRGFKDLQKKLKTLEKELKSVKKKIKKLEK